MSMSVEGIILAVITTNPKKSPHGAWIFHCDNENEMHLIAEKLEAILDGIAHSLTDELMIIVKH